MKKTKKNTETIDTKPKSQKIERKKRRQERSEKKRSVKTVADKIQLVGREGDWYRTKEGDLMDILKINGVSGVSRFTQEDRDHLINQYAGGLRTLNHLPIFIILDFLVNHQSQINLYEYKHNQLTEELDSNGYKRYWLAKEIDKLKQRQLDATEEQYFVLVFGVNDQQLLEHENQLKRISALKIDELELSEKDALLFQLHNLNSLPLSKFRNGSDVDV